jgi:hypothetical protein
MTDQQILEIAHAIVASEGQPRPRIDTPYCARCCEESHRETPVCDGVVMELSKALIAATKGKDDLVAVVTSLRDWMTETIARCAEREVVLQDSDSDADGRSYERAWGIRTTLEEALARIAPSPR